MATSYTQTDHPIDRDSLTRYGVEDYHTHCAEWISEDRQVSMVLGLGETPAEAEMEAMSEVRREGFTTGTVIIRPIAN